jgi:serine/threonine-protein kinase
MDHQSTSRRDAEESRSLKRIAKLGSGGMADVFLALRSGAAGTRKLVVLKQLREDMASDREVVEMFLSEARIATLLSHPNLVHAHDIHRDGNELVLEMEYLQGQPLSRVLSVAGPTLTRAMRVRIVADALAGLHAAHELKDLKGSSLGLVHRDISPPNIFVTYDGITKIVDFGVAKSADREHATQTGVFKGKIPYASPEQAQGGAVDRRCDIFAVGVVLWELLAERRMWKGKNHMGILMDLANARIPCLADASPDVPEPLHDIVARALAPQPEDRYPTAEAFQRELEDWLSAAGGRMDPRQIGAVINDAFREERKAMAETIELQLRRLADGQDPNVSSLPDIAIAHGESRSSPVATPPAVAGDTPPPSRARTLATVAVGASLIVAGALLIAFSQRASPARASNDVPASAPSALPSPAPPPSGPAPERRPALVRIELRVLPAIASLEVNGRAATNPFVVEVEERSAPPRVRASLMGYVPREGVLDTSASGTWTWDLVPVAARGRPVLPPALASSFKPAEPPPASADRPAPPVTNKPGPKRSVDEQNPYQP